NGETKTTARIGDLMAVIPAIIGKIEMVYEGEQEGAVNVSYALIRSAIRTQAVKFFPEIKDLKKLKNNSSETYTSIIDWFSNQQLDLLDELSERKFRAELDKVRDLKKIIQSKFASLPEEGVYLMMEYLLHSLAEYSYLSKQKLEKSFQFGDLLSSMFSSGTEL
ncbi:MAG: magnesium chelatase, partial [Flavobacteriales bacterium]|nr:magnesium chelatase [Flavobacteriales bacterium]